MAGYSRKRGNKNITEEPSTLVYTLLDPTKLSFNKFDLIVRSLHSYMVDDIVKMPATNSVHVKLLYQASTANAIKKLGPILPQYIAVNKLSTYVNETELTALDALKKEFGFGAATQDCDDQPVLPVRPPAKKPKTPKYKPVPELIEEDSE